MTPDEVDQLATAELEKAKAHPPPPRVPGGEPEEHLPERFALRTSASIGTTLVLAMQSADRADRRVYLFHFDLSDWPEGDLQSAGNAVFEVLMRCTEDPTWRENVVPLSESTAIVPITGTAYRLAGLPSPI